MVTLTCKNHPNLRWNTKDIAVNKDGSYNGNRRLFFKGNGVDRVRVCPDTLNYLDECSCSASYLTRVEDVA